MSEQADDLPRTERAEAMSPSARAVERGALPIRLGTVLWPAFLMAGVMEMLIFAVVDPSDLHWFGGERVDWPREAVYSVTFLLCWAVIGLSGGLTALLAAPADEINRRSLAKHFP